MHYMHLSRHDLSYAGPEVPSSGRCSEDGSCGDPEVLTMHAIMRDDGATVLPLPSHRGPAAGLFSPCAISSRRVLPGRTMVTVTSPPLLWYHLCQPPVYVSVC